LVEDHPPNAKLMIAYLSKMGYEVTWARNADEMWHALTLSQPALILMDVHLPQTDGLTLTRQLRQQPQYQQLPIIAQTAMAMSGDRQLCLEAGATDYITKPIDLNTLGELVSHYSHNDRYSD
jgi:CheY-like chemotaxis protein